MWSQFVLDLLTVLAGVCATLIGTSFLMKAIFQTRVSEEILKKY